MKNKNIKTVIHYYKFDISNENEKEQYQALSEKLTAQGLTKFDFISSVGSGQKEIAAEMTFRELIQSMSGKEIELETDHLFNNQWNTAPIGESKNGLRVFDWSEPIYPNKRIKSGHYLEQTQEMRDLRKYTYKCQYCGANYFRPDHKFCTKCLGSEYLTEDNLPLLHLIPIAEDDYRNRKRADVPQSLLNEYQERQRIARTARNEKHKADKLAGLKQDIENAQKEFDAFQWLIDHNLDFDNVIYYKHTNTFSFGWRTPLSEDERNFLKQALNDFPYQWEFNKK